MDFDNLCVLIAFWGYKFYANAIRLDYESRKTNITKQAKIHWIITINDQKTDTNYSEFTTKIKQFNEKYVQTFYINFILEKNPRCFLHSAQSGNCKIKVSNRESKEKQSYGQAGSVL